jgi:hypothetical protein
MREIGRRSRGRDEALSALPNERMVMVAAVQSSMGGLEEVDEAKAL